MTETFQLKINGRVHAVSVEPETPLLYFFDADADRERADQCHEMDEPDRRPNLHRILHRKRTW